MMTKKQILKWLWKRRLIVSLYCLLISTVWNVGNTHYLRGLAEGINTNATDPVKKVENILDWLEYRSGLVGETEGTIGNQRDVIGILSGKQFLRVCGTASFAFVNIAKESGLEARRLILMGPGAEAKHVVSEVLIDDKWVVVDPAFTTLMRDSNGKLLTRENLKNPAVLKSATKEMANYQDRFTYENATHLRFESVPLLGKAARWTLNLINSNWEDHVERFISLFNQNSSIAALVSFVFVLFSIPGSERPRAQLPVI
jgi:hypothetical protein